ncbi:uncharacterized protein [Choristoneura fumiferana]|uniref:uncharacterized protein n=1 Tax=Choristoneura fumiferana TaxID=7141 RepID=UPI003D157D2A
MDEVFDSDEPFIYRLNDNGTGPSLLVKVCSERGWRVYQGYSGYEERWNLWWRTSAFPAACYKTLGDWQFMNHIPKGGSICRKDSLSRLLRCMRRIYGSIYDFSPPCFHLPLEYAKLVSECSRLRRGDDGGASAVWIHKPVAQSQGRGIFLFRSVCEMRCGSAAVAQRYIERPLLIAGYKFDLRLYVCVAGYRPLTAYMYAEGLARFGTDKYTLSDIHNPYRHLTNSSLNKTGPRYAECKDRIGSGCKWTLKQVRRALVGRWEATEWLVWQRIRALVTLTLLAQASGTPPARNCFEFYGFDVLLDDALKPWLLEVNLSPALAADCEADVAVKRPMLHELFDLLGLPMRHTGLALLQGPLTALQNSGSEDENGGQRAQRPRAPASALRRGTTWRRRRAMPIHCVTLVPPSVEKDTVTSFKLKDNPPCFHLPLEYAKLVSECSRLRRGDDGGASAVWIHKPVAQSQGRGIFLFRSVCEMRCGSAAVAQRYIERPLLIAGYKFDLRLYVCVAGYRPLTAYMYAEGLARFGTDKYTLSDIHNPYRHLTNSSLNKTGPRYAECKDRIGSGCKWTLKQVRRALVGRWEATEWLVWQRIRALVTLTLLAQASGTPPARNCFEFYGFDVLLDDALKPWLLEVNLSPALAADCEADVAVKRPMLHELFDLLGLPMRHTGLALLQGPLTALQNSGSEDENGGQRAQRPRAPASALRRGTTWRRRRAMPIHCVTLVPPSVEKDTESNEKGKEESSGSSSNSVSSQASPEEPETQITPSPAVPILDVEAYYKGRIQKLASVAPPSAEVADESWRGGAATAASRRRMINACSWGNGVRWERAPGRVGQWVRIYPHTLPNNNEIQIEDVRDSVAQVSKFVRAAREVARENAKDARAPRDASRDADFEATLRKKMASGPHFEVWLPPV